MRVQDFKHRHAIRQFAHDVLDGQTRAFDDGLSQHHVRIHFDDDRWP